jgi:hypothetical protein
MKTSQEQIQQELNKIVSQLDIEQRSEYGQQGMELLINYSCGTDYGRTAINQRVVGLLSKLLVIKTKKGKNVKYVVFLDKVSEYIDKHNIKEQTEKLPDYIWKDLDDELKSRDQLFYEELKSEGRLEFTLTYALEYFNDSERLTKRNLQKLERKKLIKPAGLISGGLDWCWEVI